VDQRLAGTAAAHVLELLGAAQQYPAIASRFVNGFDNPPDFAEWFLDPGKAALPRRHQRLKQCVMKPTGREVCVAG